jgi:hypothetical protein
MKKLFLYFVLSAMVFPVFAKGKDVKKTDEPATHNVVLVAGRVTDSHTGETLAGVEVQLEGTAQKTYTDFDGNFVFKNVKTGEYTLVIHYISYEKTRVENQKIPRNTHSLEVKLDPVKL